MRSDVDDLRVGQEMGVLCRRQSRNRDRTAGKESRPAKARAFAGANPTVIWLRSNSPPA